MTNSGDETGWTWVFFDRARREFERLEPHAQDRIVSKLDEVVTDQWRDPDDYVEPLTGAPHGKLRVGQFRLGADVDHDEQVLNVYTIEKREGAYRPGDD